MATGNGTFSVIGSDVTIKGDIVASADLHVDGRIEGDIACASIVQGESSVIVGTVTTESARLAGTVSGSISARELTVLRTARIEGDVQYDALTIEQGAEVEGRFSHRTATAAPAAAADAPRAEGDDEPRLILAS
jgi:cytoskeletal protein CcmA (bactofilin family)